MLESKAAARPDAARLLDVLTESGYVIIDAATSPTEIAVIDAAIAAYLHRSPYPERDMAGRRTRRIGGILKRAPETRALVTNRSVLDVADAVLGPSCDRLQLNVAEAAEVAVGETLQPPHRECSLWPAQAGNAELAINAIWPLTADDEGPYRIWAGSHGPNAEFVDTPVCPDVPPGSVLLLLGSVLRSANRNRGKSPRRHLTVGYALGWLRTAENQWLTYPPSVARDFSPDLAGLVGYRRHRPNLGSVDGRCPSRLLTGLPDEGTSPDEDSLTGDQAAAASAYLEIQAELEAHDDRPQ